MGPLDRIPEKALARELARRSTEGSEFKGSFQAIGSGSVVTHRIFSPDTFDLQLTASTTEDTMIFHRADIEFIPDDMTLGGALCHRLLVRVLDTSNDIVTYVTPFLERRITSDGKQKWSIYHTTFGYPSDTIRLKFFFFTTGSGTFTTTIVN